MLERDFFQCEDLKNSRWNVRAIKHSNSQCIELLFDSIFAHLVLFKRAGLVRAIADNFLQHLEKLLGHITKSKSFSFFKSTYLPCSSADILPATRN